MDSPSFPECETIITAYDDSFRYCGFSVGQMGGIGMSPFTPLTDGEIVSPRDLLFLDTETTGLNGGSGTVAFLLGVGHYYDGGFIVKQYLMRDYDEEQSLLTHLIAEMGGHGTLVTYNGKAFDMNLLESRFIMNGMRMPGGKCHIDLLRPARRVWRRCLDNCRLTTIENDILGERRVEDIPGSLIPQLYFDYLETREYELLQGILLHNRLDIIAMAAVLTYLSDLIARTGRGDPYDTSRHNIADRLSAGKLADRTSEELLGLAGFFYSLKDTDFAETCLLKCLERGKPAVSRRALTFLAEMNKRGGKHDAAAEYWKRLLSFAPAAGLYPYLELAKYYEHKRRDPVSALEYADQALLIALGPVYRNSGARIQIEARRERLSKKIDRLRRENAAR